MGDQIAEKLEPCPLCAKAARVFRKSGVTGKVCRSRFYRERVACIGCGLTTAEHKATGEVNATLTIVPEGSRILSPGVPDPETRVAAAKVADEAEERNPDAGHRDVAAAIRAMEVLK